MLPNSPLAKYYRQPKLYISLPSRGEYWPPGSIAGSPDNLPVFGMTAMDEIMFKTPDALFSGEAMVNVIKSCIPNIIEPWATPQIDVDSILIAIRSATYGERLKITFKCSECKTENDREYNLQNALDYFSSIEYKSTVFCDPLTIKLRPYSYKEFTDLQMQIYQLQRTLAKTVKDNEDNASKKIDEFYKSLAKLQAESFKTQIQHVEADDTVVNDKQEIINWINNSEKIFFDTIKKHLEEQKKVWEIQDQEVACESCEHINKVSIDLDNSNFFVKG